MHDPDHQSDQADQTDQLDRWIATGDLDELIREIDRCAERGGDDGWARVLLIRDRSRSATERGHQLWPAASYAEYRTALDAPADWAATVVVDGAGFLAPGPLTEVVAQRHTWAEISGDLAEGPTRTLVFQERVLRGENLTAVDAGPGSGAGDELPPRLMAWEPDYPLAEYHADRVRFPAPDLGVPDQPMNGRVRSECVDGRDGSRALDEAVRHWAAHSDGSVRALCVDGSAADAITTILGGRTALARRVAPADAAALLAWAGASGGSRGRRRGMAVGRFEAWWAFAVLAGMDEHWPVDPGPAVEELDWWTWAPAEPPTGWVCRIAVADPTDGLAWALDATDRATEG